MSLDSKVCGEQKEARRKAEGRKNNCVTFTWMNREDKNTVGGKKKESTKEGQMKQQFDALDERMNFKVPFPIWKNIQLNISSQLKDLL